MDVGGRLHPVPGQPPGRRQAGAARALTGLGQVEHQRRAGDRQVRGPRPADLARLVQVDHGRDTAHRVIPVPPADLDERASRSRGEHRQADPRRQFVRPYVGLQGTKKKITGINGPLPAGAGQHDGPAEQREHGGHLAGRVGMHDAADRRPPVPDHRVRDQRQRLGD
jgi:hypothetical protein